MKIKAIRIENYKSIETLDLTLSDFTVLMGRSDQGKSAIVDAVRDLFTNPSGSGVIRHGSTWAAVSVVIDDGTVIKYSRTPSPHYEIKRTNGDILRYQKMGREVPDEVSHYVRLWQVAGTDDFNVHFQGQFDPAFLLSQTKNAVSRGMDDLDSRIYAEALTRCQSSSRSLNRRETQLLKQEDAWTKKVEILSAIPDIEDAVLLARGRLQFAVFALTDKIREMARSFRNLKSLLIYADAVVEKIKPSAFKLFFRGYLMRSLPDKLVVPSRALFKGLALRDVPQAVAVPNKVLFRGLILRDAPERVPEQKLMDCILRLLVLERESERSLAEQVLAVQELEESRTAMFASGICPLCGKGVI